MEGNRNEWIREIFANAVEKADATARAAYLGEACGADHELRGLVESLLQAHQQSATFAETLEQTADETDEELGTLIGRYRLLQLIGEGGFGRVYMAEQVEPVRRKVALKIIKLGMDTREVVARFEAERQALALMDHPNIAQVLDGGATDKGRPYFVMELVKGIPITDYCDQQNRSTRERLELFLKVCHAVQHAHQKGVMHRDLKPSNILVTERDGEALPKVIDFGVAKAIGQPLTDKPFFTRFEQMIGTPAYMSPEQAGLGSLDLDTRTDIYALGVLLYELLTATTPVQQETLHRMALEEIRRMIRETEAPKPSTRLQTLGATLTIVAQHRHTEPLALAKLVRGDLDWIVMRCLEKDRARRYDTANALAADIKRHLEHEPVTARSPSAAYRIQKFVQRNKVSVAAGTVVVTALVLGMVVSAWQAMRASRLRVRAESNGQKALQAQAEEAKQRLAAEQGRRLAQANELLARQNAYAADVNIANTAWRENYLGQAMTALRRQVPKPGETDLRGIEWRYLWYKCQGQQSKTFRHDTEVTSAELSPDGRWLTTVSGGAFWAWDTARGGERRVLSSGAPRDIGLGLGDHLAFDPQGRFLATATTSEVLIWDLTDWHKLKSLPATSATSLCFCGDGTRLATSGEEGVQVWKVATWEPMVIPGKFGVSWSNCRRLALNRDGSLLAVSWQNTWRSENLAVGEVTLWRVPECQLLFKWSEIKDGVAVAFSDDDRWLAACTMGPPSMVWLWSLPGGKPTAQWLACPRLGRALAFAPGGNVLATAGSDHAIRLWDTGHTDRLPRLLQGHLNEIFSLKFTADGRLVSASGDNTACLWNIQEARTNRPAFSVPPGRLVCAQTADGNRMVTVNLTDLTFEEWDMESSQCLRQESIQGADAILRHGAFSDGTPLQKGLLVNNYIYDGGVTNGEPRLRYLGPPPPSPGSPPWDLSATMGDGRFYAWNAGSGDLVYSNQFTTALLAAFPVAAYKKLILIEDQGGALSLYDLLTCQTDRIEEHVPLMPPAWEVSPDGRLFSYFMTNDQVRVYDATTKRTRLSVKLPDTPIHTVTAEFSPDSRLLAVSTWGGRVQVWDVSAGRPVGNQLPRYSADSWKVSFSVDSKSLVTYCMDYTARIWDIATSREMLSGLPSNGFLNFHLQWMLLPPDGNSVLEGVGEQAIRVVRLPTLAEIDALEKGQIKGQ